MSETSVNLITSEMMIILTALNNLTLREEKQIAEEYGSVSALYNKIYSIWEHNGGKTDQFQKLNDPSF
jgi:hypothetical protein